MVFDIVVKMSTVGLSVGRVYLKLLTPLRVLVLHLTGQEISLEQTKKFIRRLRRIYLLLYKLLEVENFLVKLLTFLKKKTFSVFEISFLD